jgi:hypothetical protein
MSGQPTVINAGFTLSAPVSSRDRDTDGHTGTYFLKQ